MTSGAGGSLLHVLVAWLVVILVARVLGLAFKLVHQPPVIGEVIAGIALGPSLLGRLAPASARFLFPPSVASSLSVIAQVGVVLFMFLVGLELDTSRLRARTRTIVAVSHASIALPFAFGLALAVWLHPRLAPPGVPLGTFAPFLGVALAVTAFPVLARMLTDLGLYKTRLGVTALSCAAAGDATAWCLLAGVVSLATAEAAGAVRTLALVAGYLAGMLLVVRPLVGRALDRQELRNELPPATIGATLLGLLASTLATEAMGIHAIFGAFLLGAIIPHDSRLARELVRRLNDVVVALFLPAFFAFTGLRTELGLLSGAGDWAICALIVALASVGKIGGAFAAARVTGLPPRDALSLGVLMNTRGLMELVVLNVGLDLGLVSRTLFAMLVLMAVATTVATTPLLKLSLAATSQQALPERSSS